MLEWETASVSRSPPSVPPLVNLSRPFYCCCCSSWMLLLAIRTYYIASATASAFLSMQYTHSLSLLLFFFFIFFFGLFVDALQSCCRRENCGRLLPVLLRCSLPLSSSEQQWTRTSNHEEPSGIGFSVVKSWLRRIHCDTRADFHCSVSVKLRPVSQ